MAPLPAEGANVPNTTATLPSAYSVQIILGVTLPLLAVASFIPIIMIKRHLTTKHILSERSTSNTARSTATTAPTSGRAQNTPRLPLTSIYIARVDYYLPPSETGVSQTVAESQLECSVRDNDSLSDSSDEVKNDDNANLAEPSVGLGLVPEVPAMLSLPSLSSMLCEFTAYADVIEPENLAEARRSSSCLLDSVFSFMDVKTLSLAELPVSPTLPPIQTVASGLSLDFQSFYREKGVLEGKQNGEGNGLRSAPTQLEKKASSLFYREQPVMVEELDSAAATQCDVDIDTVPPPEDEIEEISTSQLVSTTTICSISVDSSSTLASLLAVRLSQFPPVPALPSLSLLSFAARSLITRRSQSSLGSTITCSLSAPASLNILEIQLDEALPQGRANGSLLEDWPSFSNPGELWDEEDDLLFSVCLPKKQIDLSKPVRHTWTAGIRYSRSDKGDLWDDEDDRRFSFAGELKPLDIFVSGSMFNLEMSSKRVLADSTLYMTEGSSLADHSREAQQAMIEDATADRTLCCSESELNFIDSGFAENVSCFDFRFSSSFKEQDMKCEGEFESGSGHCSPCCFGFEDLGDDGVNATAIYLSESSRSSLMSLASVLDSPIRVEDPPLPPSHAPSLPDLLFPDNIFLSEDLEKMFEVEVEVVTADADMELEPDVSYCSRIISVNHPLFRLGEEEKIYQTSKVTAKASSAAGEDG